MQKSECGCNIFVNLVAYLLGVGCSWSVVDDVYFVSIGEVIIDTVFYINFCTDDSRIPLNFVEVRRCMLCCAKTQDSVHFHTYLLIH